MGSLVAPRKEGAKRHSLAATRFAHPSGFEPKARRLGTVSLAPGAAISRANGAAPRRGAGGASLWRHHVTFRFRFLGAAPPLAPLRLRLRFREREAIAREWRFTDFILFRKRGVRMNASPTQSSSVHGSAPATPQLPASVTQWSVRRLAEHLGVSASTVKYHARQMFRRRAHTGRWEFNPEQAQRVANHIYQFGQRDTLRRAAQTPAPEDVNEG